MMRLCLEMKVKTLGMLSACCLLIAFIFIIYATSTAPKVQPRDKTPDSQLQQQQHSRKLVVEMEQDKRAGVEVVTEKWDGEVGRMVRPGDSDIPVIIQSAVRHLPADNVEIEQLPAAATVFETDQLPTDPRLRPGLGNGHIATVVYSDSIYMNGVYNGFHSQSHRARIPAFCSVQVTGIHPPAEVKRTYTLNTTTGIFTERITGPYFIVEHNMFAHRRIKELLVTEIKLSRSVMEKPIDIGLTLKRGGDSEDIDFKEEPTMIAGSKYVYGKVKRPEYNDSTPQEVHVYYADVPTNISLSSSMSESTYLYITSVSHTKRGAEDNYDRGLKLFQVKSLTYSHTSMWAKLWMEGRIDIQGNTQLAQICYSSLYYLLSCLPSEEKSDWPFVGLSPEGLDHGSAKENYWGHVMWDQETWQYPPILMLYPDLASMLISTRSRTLKAAQRQAKLRGYRGAMYPWESAFTGRDVTVSDNCTRYEHHITGDIALAIQQYLYMTNDVSLLKEGGGTEIITAIADFWASRVTLDKKTGKYGILGVMPPDEYHYPVNNSVYTNAIAEISLMLPSFALPLIGQQPPSIYKEIASKLYMPYNSAIKYHPEYDGYTVGTRVKQADVILLGFPLMKESDSGVRKKDLTIYSEVTDPEGPAMTWQMFTIGWLEFKETSKAKTYLDRSIKNVKGPFKVWTENSDGTGAVNFRTGMGGFLQAMIFGYGGFRIRQDGLYFDPTLPSSSTKFIITSLDYLGNSIDFIVDERTTEIAVTKEGVPIVLKIPGMSTEYPLTVKKSVTISKHKAIIKRK